MLHESNVETGRRKILNRGVGSVMSILVGGTMLDQPAEASYSAYTAREKDWQQRMEKGGASLIRFYDRIAQAISQSHAV